MAERCIVPGCSPRPSTTSASSRPPTRARWRPACRLCGGADRAAHEHQVAGLEPPQFGCTVRASARRTKRPRPEVLPKLERGEDLIDRSLTSARIHVLIDWREEVTTLLPDRRRAPAFGQHHRVNA